MVATVAAITEQQLIFVVPTMTKLAILQPKRNFTFKKDERMLTPRVAKVAWRFQHYLLVKRWIWTKTITKSCYIYVYTHTHIYRMFIGKVSTSLFFKVHVIYKKMLNIKVGRFWGGNNAIYFYFSNPVMKNTPFYLRKKLTL